MSSSATRRTSRYLKACRLPAADTSAAVRRSMWRIEGDGDFLSTALFASVVISLHYRICWSEKIPLLAQFKNTSVSLKWLVTHRGRSWSHTPIGDGSLRHHCLLALNRAAAAASTDQQATPGQLRCFRLHQRSASRRDQVWRDTPAEKLLKFPHLSSLQTFWIDFLVWVLERQSLSLWAPLLVP